MCRLLQENGSALLQENGSFLLLEICDEQPTVLPEVTWPGTTTRRRRRRGEPDYGLARDLLEQRREAEQEYRKRQEPKPEPEKRPELVRLEPEAPRAIDLSGMFVLPLPPPALLPEVVITDDSAALRELWEEEELVILLAAAYAV